jgi:hypothetical protein
MTEISPQKASEGIIGNTIVVPCEITDEGYRAEWRMSQIACCFRL